MAVQHPRRQLAFQSQRRFENPNLNIRQHRHNTAGEEMVRIILCGRKGSDSISPLEGR
jgi:hypothetical protein